MMEEAFDYLNAPIVRVTGLVLLCYVNSGWRRYRAFCDVCDSLRTHGKPRHVCATQGVLSQLNKVILDVPVPSGPLHFSVVPDKNRIIKAIQDMMR